MTTDKENKRKARRLRDDAAAAFEAGDYRRGREISLEIVALAPDTDIGAQAKVDAENTKTDPYTIYGGMVFLALYTIGWLVALFA